MSNIEMKRVVMTKIVDFAESAFSNAFKKELIPAKATFLTDNILDAVQGELYDEVCKAVGECKHCFGKGYSSSINDVPEFPSNKIKTELTTRDYNRLEYKFCKCERGQALKHLIVSNAAWVL